MQGSYITLKEVLDAMDRGESFSIRFCTVGGEWVDMQEARKHSALTPQEKKKQEQLQPTSTIVRKNPNHYPNSTRNLRFPNGEIRKCKIRLIRRFNDKTVL